MNLADNLKRIRKDNNLSQEQLAEKLGVTRQAVSKWESGLSYPEMDKVIQICQLFNLNINELIHENIKEVNERKNEKDNVSKIIDGFFAYITKVVDLFFSMKFKDVVKCLIEQCVIATILIVLFWLIVEVGYQVFWNIFTYLPHNTLAYTIVNLVESFYLMLAIIIGVIIFLHIFKIRYLDYYEIVDKEIKNEDAVEEIKDDNNEIEETKEKKVIENKKEKIVLERKKEKIIVRDPKHSEYRFIKVMLNAVLWFIKLMAGFVLLGLAISMVTLIGCLVVSFLIMKSGLLFVSVLLAILGSIGINYLLIIVFYNFMMSRKNSRVGIFSIFISSIVLIGVGLGLSLVSLSQFDVINEEYKKTESEYNIKMADNLAFFPYYADEFEYEYIISDNEDVKLIIEHSEYDIIMYSSYNGVYHFYSTIDPDKAMRLYRQVLSDLNKKRIVNYYNSIKIKIYTTEENINIIKNNIKSYQETRDRIADLNEEINNLNDNLDVAQIKINELEYFLREHGYDVSYNEYGYAVITGEEDW